MNPSGPPMIFPGMPMFPPLIPTPGIPGAVHPINPILAMQMAATAPETANGIVEEEPEDENDPEKKANTLEIQHGARYNMEHILSDNILKSEYFKSLYELRTYDEVVEESERKVKHLEPHLQGFTTSPSTAFCLLYKLMIMKVTVKQLSGLLNHNSLLIKGMGFLYMRYLVPAKKLWDYYEPYLCNRTEFTPTCNASKTMELGKWLEGLITESKYCGSMLPRIPVPVMRQYKKNLILLARRQERDAEHEKYRRQFKSGSKIEAEYFEDNKWYDAKVDQCIKKSGHFLVTFLEYGNQEEVTIGQMRPSSSGDSKKKSASRSKSKTRSRHRSRSKSKTRSRHRSRSKSKTRSRHRSRSKSKTRSRHRSRSKSKTRSRRRHRSKSASRSKSRSRRSRKRRRSRSRSRKRSRSRSRRRRSRSGSRSRRSHREKRRKKHRSRRSRSRSRSRSKRSRSKSAPRSQRRSPAAEEEDLDALIARQERESAQAVGRDYARRPTSYKTSLSIPMQVGTARERSATPPPVRSSRSYRVVDDEPSPPPKAKKSKQYLEKMNALRKVYGDASAKQKSKKK
eukprot:575921_1